MAVNNGGALAGNGFISGQGQIVGGVPTPVTTLVTVAPGGIVSPSGEISTSTPVNSGGVFSTLSMDALTLSASSGALFPTLNFEIGTTTTGDLINVTLPSNLTITNGYVTPFNSTGTAFSSIRLAPTI